MVDFFKVNKCLIAYVLLGAAESCSFRVLWLPGLVVLGFPLILEICNIYILKKYFSFLITSRYLIFTSFISFTKLLLHKEQKFFSV